MAEHVIAAKKFADNCGIDRYWILLRQQRGVNARQECLTANGFILHPPLAAVRQLAARTRDLLLLAQFEPVTSCVWEARQKEAHPAHCSLKRDCCFALYNGQLDA